MSPGTHCSWVPGAVKPFWISAEQFLLLQHCHSHTCRTQNWLEKERGTNCIAPNETSFQENRHVWGGMGRIKTKARIFSWRDQLCRRQFLLYWKQEKRSRLWARLYPNCLLNPEPCFNSTQCFFKLEHTSLGFSFWVAECYKITYLYTKTNEFYERYITQTLLYTVCYIFCYQYS